ncbi:MAG: PAS domain S-box protein, partial [Thermodesulfovibrionales bacterium]|nr:PAS domain S-box protein [Thermodesulfovibrionales bacterium]
AGFQGTMKMSKRKNSNKHHGPKNPMNPEEFCDESAQLNALIIEHAAEGICICHNIPEYPHVKFTIWNNHMQDITGYTMDEINRSGWYQTVYPDPELQGKAIGRMDRMREGVNLRNEPWEITRKDGEKRTVTISTSVIRTEKGSVHVLALMKDITEQKKTKEKFKEQFAFLERLLNTLPNPVFYKDLEGKYLGCNEAFEQFTGMERKNIIGKTVYDMEPKAIADKFSEQDKELFRNPGIQTYEWKLSDKNGKIRDLLFNKGTFTDTAGNTAGLIGIIANISERKKAEYSLKKAYDQILLRQNAMLNLSEDLMREIEEREQIEGQLRESEEKYRMLFEAESDAIMVLDGETRKFVHVNNAAVTLYGYPFEEFLNMRLQDISAEPEESEKTFRSTLSGEIVKVPLRYHRKKDGTVFSVEISAGTFIMKEKQMIISAVRDISERTKAEEILRQYQARLSALASQIALIDEEERRRFANELHDFTGQNLALAKIMLSELESSVYDRDLQGRLKELRQLIEKSVESTRSLTFELSPPILYELGFEAAADWLGEQLLKRYNIMFHFQDDRQPKPLPDNTKVLLYLSLRELIVNIAKHAKARNATLSIRRQDNDIQVTVADDGIGFDASDMDYQIMKASSFGLFSTRERLERLGGKLEIASKPGEGTTVTMVAPLKE